MPTFKCYVCGTEWPNTFKMSRCPQSEECMAKAKAAEAGVKEVSSSSRPAYEFDFSAARGGDIKRKDGWADFGVDGVHHAMGGLGSLGVFLANLKGDGGVIVAKQGSIQSASEFYCSLMYKQLGCDAPQMRVMAMAEWERLVEAFGDVCFTSPGAGDALQSRGKQRGALLQDFCPGVTLKHPDAATYLQDAAYGPHLLKQFGRIIAVDMLCNNFDRSPLIWNHEGNANNVLIRAVGGQVIVRAIDQGVTAIRPHDDGDETMVKEYLDKVQMAVFEAAKKEHEGPCITKVRDFFTRYTGVDIGAEGCAHVQEGIMDGAVACGTFRDFEGLFHTTAEAFSSVSAVWGLHGMDSINMPFLDLVSNAMADAVGDSTSASAGC